MKSTAWRPQLPQELVTLIHNAEANTEYGDAVLKVAYAAGWTLQEIAEVLDVTRERIRQRINRPVKAQYLAELDGAIAEKPSRPRKGKVRKPIEFVPQERLDEIAQLQKTASQTRGFTALDDPIRQAGRSLCELVVETMKEYGVGVYALSKAIGASPQTLRLRLSRWGYAKCPPSQAEYRDVCIRKATAA